MVLSCEKRIVARFGFVEHSLQIFKRIESMKKFVLLPLLILFMQVIVSQTVFALSPSEEIVFLVDKVILTAKDQNSSDVIKQAQLETLVTNHMELEYIAKRILNKHWDGATDEQKANFIALFRRVIVNTYFKLLKNYKDESVKILNEQVKDEKLAIVDTEIVAKDKKTPVRYRLVKIDNTWKLYDFIPEGVSFITSYRNSYSPILKESGMKGLLVELAQRS